MILEKLHEKFELKETFIWDIRNYLTRGVRIPKDLTLILLAELVNENLLIKVEKRKYKLNKDKLKDIEKEKAELKIIRNRTFI